MNSNNESLGSILFGYMKSVQDPSFTKEEYNNLISLYKNQDLTQFYLLIIQKILDSGKNFSLPESETKTEFIAILTDTVHPVLNQMPSHTDEDIINIITTVYKLLYIIDISAIYNKRF